MPEKHATFCPSSSDDWRAWLATNGVSEDGVWLIYHKKKTNMPSLLWTDAVDEALCFGWIDSQAKPIDEHQYMQLFTKRKPKSVWSKVNKDKVSRLIAAGKMTEHGLKCINIAKENGSWTILDTAEALIVPEDLQIALTDNPNAESYFLNLSRSDKRNILQWLVMAKRAETRQNRITEIVELADQGLKPKQFRTVKA